MAQPSWGGTPWCFTARVDAAQLLGQVVLRDLQRLHRREEVLARGAGVMGIDQPARKVTTQAVNLGMVDHQWSMVVVNHEYPPC